MKQRPIALVILLAVSLSGIATANARDNNKAWGFYSQDDNYNNYTTTKPAKKQTNKSKSASRSGDVDVFSGNYGNSVSGNKGVEKRAVKKPQPRNGVGADANNDIMTLEAPTPSFKPRYINMTDEEILAEFRLTNDWESLDAQGNKMLEEHYKTRAAEQKELVRVLRETEKKNIENLARIDKKILEVEELSKPQITETEVKIGATGEYSTKGFKIKKTHLSIEQKKESGRVYEDYVVELDPQNDDAVKTLTFFLQSKMQKGWRHDYIAVVSQDNTFIQRQMKAGKAVSKQEHRFSIEKEAF